MARQPSLVVVAQINGSFDSCDTLLDSQDERVPPHKDSSISIPSETLYETDMSNLNLEKIYGMIAGWNSYDLIDGDHPECYKFEIIISKDDGWSYFEPSRRMRISTLPTVLPSPSRFRRKRNTSQDQTHIHETQI